MEEEAIVTIGRTVRWRKRMHRRLQALKRMRIPRCDHRNALLVHLVEAILRNGKIDKEGLYEKALEQVSREEGVAALLDEVRCMYVRIQAESEKLNDEGALKKAVAESKRVLSERRFEMSGADPFSVVDAIRRGAEVDYDCLYKMALGAENFTSLLGEFEPLVKAIVYGTEGDAGDEALEELLANIARVFFSERDIDGEGESDVPTADLFNETLLNSNGREALATVIGFDLLGLIPKRFDRSVGGEIQDVLHGSRPKRLQKRLGPKLKRLLDERYSMDAITNRAVRRAADRYVVYHHECGRDKRQYKIEMDQVPKKRRVHRMRYWFGKFDDALGL